MQVKFLQQFLKTESAGGLFLLISAILAIILANSPFSGHYDYFVNSYRFLVNEVLMTIFFLLVGLELKREWASGILNPRTIRLPLFAALGGMLVPAILFLIINASSPLTIRGWPIPIATDIAFALAVLKLFGRVVPITLKIFLLSLAIFDDIGAILIILFNYTRHISWVYIFVSALTLSLLFLVNRFTQRLNLSYFFLGILLWFSFLKSGIHPTITGFVLALFIPLDNNNLEKKLHPWVVFGILPLFALCNAGFQISLNDFFGFFANPLILGITAGLFFGKQVGIFGFSYLLIKSKIAPFPRHVSWLSLYGVSLLCGIGFTMSLFLGTLSFAEQEIAYLDGVRMGVIVGSLLSALAGIIILRIAFVRKT